MERNIFEAASNKLRRQEKQHSVKKESPLPPLPVANPAQSQKTYGDQDIEVFEMFQRMRDMRRDLDNKLSELRNKGQSYQFDVDRYIESNKGLYSKDLEKVKQEEQAFTDQVKSLFTPETCIKKNPKTKDQLTHERKGKTLGARKKNWIPIR